MKKVFYFCWVLLWGVALFVSFYAYIENLMPELNFLFGILIFLSWFMSIYNVIKFARPKVKK